MKWLLVYVAVAQNGPATNTLEFETLELCRQRALGVLRVSAQIGLKTVAHCENPETGERIEIKLPPETTA